MVNETAVYPTHKSGVIVKLTGYSKLTSIAEVKKLLALRGSEELYPDMDEGFRAKIRRVCVRPSHAPEDCASRLPFVPEAANYKVITLKEWREMC